MFKYIYFFVLANIIIKPSLPWPAFILAISHEEHLWPQHRYRRVLTVIKRPTRSCHGAQGNMVIMTALSAVAGQLGPTPPTIPWTNYSTGWLCPDPTKGRRKRETGSSGRATSVEDVVESGTTWSHLQELLLVS